MDSVASVALIQRRETATGTMSFYFEKPRGFTFKAGQYVSFGQIDPPERDAKGNTRTFSIASAPEEADVMITTRMRDSAFKRCLKTMKFGATVTMEGPFGDLVLHGDANRPAVLLAAASASHRFEVSWSPLLARSSRIGSSSSIRIVGAMTPPSWTSSRSSRR